MLCILQDQFAPSVGSASGVAASAAAVRPQARRRCNSTQLCSCSTPQCIASSADDRLLMAMKGRNVVCARLGGVSHNRALSQCPPSCVQASALSGVASASTAAADISRIERTYVKLNHATTSMVFYSILCSAAHSRAVAAGSSVQSAAQHPPSSPVALHYLLCAIRFVSCGTLVQHSQA